MSDEKVALARRAVACPGWRWMPRMKTLSGDIVVYERGGGVEPDHPGDELPDLDDPATLGCLLALVREAWGDPQVWIGPWDGALEVNLFDPPCWAASAIARAATEAEALVTALEAAARR